MIEAQRGAGIPHYLVALSIVAMLFLPGCVRRRMLIRTYPEGALVYVDQQEIGRSPVETSFVYYGAHRILVEKDGFETIEVDERVDPPWYQWPGLDFFFENVWPYELRDQRTVEFQLQPQQQVRESELRERAEQLRGNLRQGIVAPIIESGRPPVYDGNDTLPRPRGIPAQ